MTVEESLDLVIESSNFNPYSGYLDDRSNLLAARELTKLCIWFANNGYTDEAMNLTAGHWDKVLSELNNRL